ncbi:MAG: DinB family protein [Bacillaceae bacterium]|nr:DinB family protein [Bacillaceae bacterium]
MVRSKEDIILHHTNAIHFVDSFIHLSEELWRTPVAEDKWSIAEVIGHFIPWDEFLMHNRIPYFLKAEPLPVAPNVDELNWQAACEARNASQADTIEKFISTRVRLQQTIRNIRDDYWLKDISIESRQLKLCDYFENLVKHDEHHFSQITRFLEDWVINLNRP